MRSFAPKLLLLCCVSFQASLARGESPAPAAPPPERDLFERRLREDQAYLDQMRTLYGPEVQYGKLIATLRNATELVNQGGGTPNAAAQRTIADLDEYLKTVTELQSILEKAIVARQAEPKDYSDVQATCRIQMDTINGRAAAGSVTAIEGYRPRVLSRLRELREGKWQGVGGQPQVVLEQLFRNSLNLMIEIQRRCTNIRDELAVVTANQVIETFNRSVTPEGVDRGAAPTVGEQLCQSDPDLKLLPLDVCKRRFRDGGLPSAPPRRGNTRVLGGAPSVDVLEGLAIPKFPEGGLASPGGPRSGGAGRPPLARPGS